MSKFTGIQYRGASRDLRARHRREAERRNARSQARLMRCGHVHGTGVTCGKPFAEVPA